MTLNKEITAGNIVSWAMILGGFVASYVTLRGNTTRALEVANEAKETAASAGAQINVLKTDIAVIKATTHNTDAKIDEIRNYLITRAKQSPTR